MRKMLRTCFSTASGVTTRADAMPRFDKPWAIAESTSRSRGLSSALQVEHSRLCLSVQWGGDPWGSNVVQLGCANAPTWFTEPMGGGWTRIFTFAPRGDRLCLDKSWSDVTVWAVTIGGGSSGNLWDEWPERACH